MCANIRIGRRVRHGAGYELSAADAADYLVAIDFDDVVGLQAYLRHPRTTSSAAGSSVPERGACLRFRSRRVGALGRAVIAR